MFIFQSLRLYVGLDLVKEIRNIEILFGYSKIVFNGKFFRIPITFDPIKLTY